MLETFCADSLTGTNRKHKHSGIDMLAPRGLHTGQAHQLREKRCSVLRLAYEKNP